MKKIANIVAGIFIFLVVVLAAVSIFGIWDFFNKDVVWKSFQSIGILAIVASIIIAADSLSEKHITIDENGNQVALETNPETVILFKGIRSFVTTILIISVVALAFFGILSIWDVVSGQILFKSLSSIAVIGFAAFIIIVVCLDREGKKNAKTNITSSSTVIK